MTQNPGKKIVKFPGGVFDELIIRVKLVLRLMADPRVNLFYKTIPVASLIYLIVPTDLIPCVPIDDALVIWLATYLFVELAPPDVVKEHLEELRRVVQVKWEDAPEKSTENSTENTDTSQPDVVEAEFKVVID
jgi:hypothetical protein